MSEQAEMTTAEQQSIAPGTVVTGPADQSPARPPAEETRPHNPENDKYAEAIRLLDLANLADRCAHIRADGEPGHAPRIKHGKLCYAHTRMLAARPRKLRLPTLDDANGIQLAIMEVSRAVVDGVIDRKTAALLFYGLRVAAINVNNSNFETLKMTDLVSVQTPEIQEEIPDKTEQVH